MDLLGQNAKVDVEEMNPQWPDAFFIFRDDTEKVEMAASSVNLIAQELRSALEVSLSNLFIVHTGLYVCSHTHMNIQL